MEAEKTEVNQPHEHIFFFTSGFFFNGRKINVKLLGQGYERLGDPPCG